MTALQMAKYMISSDNMNAKMGKSTQYGTSIAPDGYVPKTQEEIYAELDKDGLLLNGKGDSYKTIVPIDDSIKDSIASYVSDCYMLNEGYSHGDGVGALILEYAMTQPKEDRLSIIYTANEYYIQITNKYQEELASIYPNWSAGDSFDPSVLEGFDPQALVLDTRA